MEKLFFDEYNRKARLAPYVLLLLPLLLAAAAWLPLDDMANLAIGGTVTAAATFALSMLCVQLGRSGKAKQAALFEQWGGAPTTRMLRHTEAKHAAEVKRLHAKIERVLGDVTLPTPKQESADPKQADKTYDAVVDRLREHMRDHDDYRLVFEENKNYGFRRNLWALKPTGIMLTSIVLLGILVPAGYWYAIGAAINVAQVLVAAALNLVLLVLWITRVTKEWVKEVADAYAKQLFRSLEHVKDKDQPPSPIVAR